MGIDATIGPVLTMLFIFRLFKAARPILFHSHIALVPGCVAIGTALLGLMFRTSHGVLALMSDEPPGPFGEFIALNVTSTSIYFSSLLVFCVFACHRVSEAWPLVFVDVMQDAVFVPKDKVKAWDMSGKIYPTG